MYIKISASEFSLGATILVQPMLLYGKTLRKGPYYPEREGKVRTEPRKMRRELNRQAMLEALPNRVS